MFEGKKIVNIYSGEYYISSNSQEIIYTLLGSCVAVCLYDDILGVGGMNHFMLPQAENDRIPEFGRYGLQSMEIMIEQLLKRGATYSHLKAKVFGGSKMFDSNHEESGIASANISFILEYLKLKGIPIIAQGLGGNTGRKIYYLLEDHSVFVQRLTRGEPKQDDPKQSIK